MDKKGKFNILHMDGFREFGGAQTDVVVLLKFIKLRHEDKFNVVVIHNGNKRFKEELDRAGIDNSCIKMRNFMDIAAVFKIRRFLKKQDIDLINFHSSLDHFLGGIAAISVLNKRIVKILTRHVAYRIDFIKGFLIYRLLTDGFISIYDLIKEALTADMKIDPSKIATIYSPRIYEGEDSGGIPYKRGAADSAAVKKSVKDTLGVRPEEKMVVLIGRLSGEKGHETFINAAELLVGTGRKDIKFVIIGEGELYDRITGLIERKGLGENFVLTGFKNDIKKYILAADLIAVPSGLEGMGSIIIESCALKKAVIASNVGGIPEIIRNNDTGVIFESGNHAEFAEKIASLLDNPAEIEKLGLNCYNEVVEKFDAAGIADETAAFYLSFLKPKILKSGR